MKKFNVLLVLFVLVLITMFSKALAQSKTVKVKNGDNIKITMQYGDLSINVWEKDEVNVSWEEDEDGVSVNKNGSSIKVTTNNLSGDDLRISLPSYLDIDIITQAGDIDFNGNLSGSVNCISGGGDIDIKNVGGDVKVSTGGGDVNTGNVGGNLGVNSTGGDITVGNVGKDLSVNTSGGSVLSGKVGGELSINTAGGNISTDEINGYAKVNTSGGNIKLSGVKGNVKASTGGGNISLPYVTGEAIVSSGGGNLEIAGISGKVKAASGNGNISVSFASEITQESKIATGSGDVFLKVPGNSKITITANVGYHGVITEKEARERITSNISPDSFEIDEEKNNIKAIFKVNGGGTDVRVASGSGNIDIMVK